VGPPGEHPVRLETANEAFKRDWSRRVSWCTVLATGLHAAVFFGLPAWQRATAVPDLDEGFENVPVTLVNLGDGTGGAGVDGRGADLVSAQVVPGPDAEGPEGGTAGSYSGPSLAELWERVAPAGGLLPTVVESAPEEELAGRPVPTDATDSVDIRGRAASTEGLNLDPEAGELDLESLAAVLPELALVDLSSWVLVRNPREVDEFMRRTYDYGELSADQSGLVSVALWIDERGVVRWADIDRSSGRTDMDEVALELFREVALFLPARHEGVPVSRPAIFFVNFPWTGTPTGDEPRPR
jgi:TonB family protein